MFKVNYLEINKKGESRSDLIFLKNKNLWIFLSSIKKSRYFGGFIYTQNKVFRFLDNINFNDEIKEIYILSTTQAVIYLKNNQVFLNLKENGLEIIFYDWQNVKLTFDIKDIFTNNEAFKRNIKISKISSCFFIVEELLDGSGLLKISVETDAPLETNNIWEEVRLNFDEERNSPPYSWWVYNGLKGKIRELKLKIIFPKIEENIKQNLITDPKNFFNSKNENNNFRKFLLSRLNSFILNDYLAAGFPWFFENWFRDELLSLYFLNLAQINSEFQYFFNKRIKFYLFNLEDIWNKNKNQSSIWNWEAVDVLLLILINIPNDLLSFYSKKIERYFYIWQKKFNINNLPKFSTWMDTLDRKNALEIEVFLIKTLRKLAFLNKNYIVLANKIKSRIVKKIKENPVDVNLIFAYLFLQDIFTKNEWKKFFLKLLEENYLHWGGISTLSRNNPNFKIEDDGELAKAYHQGDSWYYLNNLLAFALFNIDKKYFRNIIIKLIKNSIEDLLFDGALGWPSEISSAKERKSEGCLAQLWSLTSLILLSRSLQNLDIFLEP